MKLVYCASDQYVSINSSLERPRCDRCNETARVIQVPKPWQYFASVGVVLAAGFFLILPQLVGGIPWQGVTATLPLRLVWLVVFLTLAVYLSLWSVRLMKADALEVGRKMYPEAEA